MGPTPVAKRTRGPNKQTPWARKPEDGVSVLRLALDTGDPIRLRHRRMGALVGARALGVRAGLAARRDHARGRGRCHARRRDRRCRAGLDGDRAVAALLVRHARREVARDPGPRVHRLRARRRPRRDGGHARVVCCRRRRRESRLRRARPRGVPRVALSRADASHPSRHRFEPRTARRPVRVKRADRP